MAQRLKNRLIPVNLDRFKKPGMDADGHGLYLRVGPNGAKSWIFRFKLNGKRRDMGLGGYPAVSLAEARALAEAQRKQTRIGYDPLELKKAQTIAAKIEAAKAMTFRQCAAAFIDAHSPGWKNEKHAAQWSSTLETYAFEAIGDFPVAAIDTPHVVNVLKPIWATKSETASRLRGRIERILDWARVSGFRSGENPARWKGHLGHSLPQRAKLAKVRHHPALPYGELAAFMASLKEQEGIAAKALEFTILTASRSNDVRGAQWREIDLEKKLWVIPGDRMKSGVEHRVLLSAPAMSIIKAMQAVSKGEYVFPGSSPSRPFAHTAMQRCLERMGCADITVHGFRSTFRDWAAEQTNFSNEVCEMALAHSIGSKVEAAYRRGELLDKRRRLMEAWAAYSAGKPAKIRLIS